METRTFSTSRAIVDNVIIAEGRDAVELRRLENMDINGLLIYRGAVVTFQRVTVTLETEMVAEYRYGYNGQKMERVISRTEDVQSEEVLVASRKKTGWTWR